MIMPDHNKVVNVSGMAAALWGENRTPHKIQSAEQAEA
jgi:hypothetical protein